MKVDVKSIVNRLLVKYPLFGSIIANTKILEERNIATACTDGSTIFYNDDFVGDLTEGEQIFIFAHEICHIAFDHIFRSEGKDKRLWNIATDAVINALLKQDKLPIIEGSVDIEDAINYNAEEMYEKLLKEKKEQENSKDNSSSDDKDFQTSQVSAGKGNNQSSDDSKTNGSNNDHSNNQNDNDNEKDTTQSNGSNGEKQENSNEDTNENNVGHDDHSIWDKAIQEKKKQDETRVNQSEAQPQTEETNKQKQERIDKLSKVGEKKAFEKNKMTRKKQLEELMDSLAQQSHSAGDEPGNNKRPVDDIGTASPLIDWRRVLKEATKFDVDWSYSNATIEHGVVTPHLDEISMPETEIVLDTSGSIDTNLLRNFLRECKNILLTSKVKVGCFDTEFYGFTEIKTVKDIDKLNFTGGGGTNFDAAVNAFTRRVENKIIFTDGEASMPSKPMDAIWVVFGNVKITPKGGKVIYINEEQLAKLSRSVNNNKTRR